MAPAGIAIYRKAMKLNDAAAPLPFADDRADPFDLLDLVSNLLIQAMHIVAERHTRPSDIPALLREIADLMETRIDGGEEALALHYLTVRLRENANNTLD
ncbi:hypothetical protein [Novosphingopyxis sp.]|uniref:hypothetical protein n=1 Tax=Novosphingopyxis sp. TaxID=2709690 RepID=UPI003B599150